MVRQTRIQKLAGMRCGLRLLSLLVLLYSMACSLPFNAPKPTATRWVPTVTPTLPPAPTATPQPMPPVLVESDPPQSAELPLNGPITLYFDQEMDRASVEAALSSQLGPGVGFTWIDNSTVILRMTQPLQPEAELSLLVGGEIRSSQGKPLLQPISLQYRTAGFLALSLALPEPGATGVDPTAAVISAFNRPIVPLGAQTADLPEAFTLEPAAAGRGEWLNTSTYVFYPEPALDGGRLYTVHLNPDLKSVDGGPLQTAEPWSFSTTLPKLVTLTPSTEIPWPIDAQVEMKFNQPMDRSAVQAAFSLVAGDGSQVPGQFEWSEDDSMVTFKPDALLARGTGYTVSLSTQAAGPGGALIEQAFSAGIITVAPLQVIETVPAEGGLIDPSDSPMLFFSAPIGPIIDDDILPYITLTPAVPDLRVFWDFERYLLRIHGTLAPSTSYSLRVAPSLTDKWGGPLTQEFALNFTTSPFRPNLNVIAPSRTMFLTSRDTGLQIQAVNVDSVPLSIGPLGLEEFMEMSLPSGYEVIETLKTRQAQTWSQPITISTERVQPAELPLSTTGATRPPGLYFLRFNFPQDPANFQNNIDNGPFLLVVSDLQITLKVSMTDALVWITDLRTLAPAAGLPVTLYDENGAQLARGSTNAQGVFSATFPALENSYSTVFAVTAAPGDPNFSLGMSTWNSGLDAWDFGLTSGDSGPGLQTYFYTDRPIYRPGQTVFYRAVVRQAFNGRFSPPQIGRLPVTISGGEGQELLAIDLPVSVLGTAHGEFILPSDAQPGYYSLNTSLGRGGYVTFQVANYRKPEINLQVDFTGNGARAGSPLQAQITARYFFDAPAGNVEVDWVLYKRSAYFQLPGYQVGREDLSWMDAYRFPSWFANLGEQVDSGEGRTDPDGLLALQFPTQPTDQLSEYSLEVTVTDESGLPVSARSSRLLHPDEFYIGIRPDAWVGQSGQAAEYEIQVVDWQKQPAGARRMRAIFQKVTWRRVAPVSSSPDALPTNEPRYTPVGSTDFITGADGRARLAFTPPDPGTYMLDVFSVATPEGQGARSQLLQWVGGLGQAVWPTLPNARMQLISDRASYQPGETARVFVPNPFGQSVQALITLERSIVMHHELRSLPVEGITLELPLPAEYAPNVFVSVTLIGPATDGRPDFRQGYINLPVEPVEQTLDVTLIGSPQRLGPGDLATFEIQVTDSTGSPVEGEFSLSVVDLAVLALADPNSEDIVSAFYKEQPIGVRTSLSLAAHNRRLLDLPAGMGGGGGADVPQVARENFPDTAYWNAEVATGPDGRATVSLDLPDTLTTWQAETRGLTLDTHVGQAQTQIVTTQELLVRPVTPRFFVANDHVELAAVVQNNTELELTVQAALQVAGFILDDPSSQTQTVTLPAQGRARVAWWGTVQNVDSVDLVFSAIGGGFEDATRPAAGSLPVLRYYAPQTFRTAGILEGEGEIIEHISLPRSFDPQSGQLTLEMAPSLAAATLRALDALESDPHESIEQVLSSFLPNLELYRSLQDFGMADAALQSRLDRNLNDALPRLQGHQSYDGGWSWWPGGESDVYITSYVLYGLLRARQAGIVINPLAIERAVDFLKTHTPGLQPEVETPEGPAATGLEMKETWILDRMVFQQFVLSEAGEADGTRLDELLVVRSQLSPWSQALLALALQRTRPGATDVQTILSDLQADAVRSATGAFWELSQDESGRLAGGYNMQSTLSNTAIVVFVLAQRDPGSPLVADAVRYLMAQRNADGAWTSTYTTAWSLIGLNEVMKATGEPNAAYLFEATLNGSPLSQGQAEGAQSTLPVTAQASIGQLYADSPNQLALRRGAGEGRLYYSVGLEVSRPVEEVTPLSQGLSITRSVHPFGDAACPDGRCEAISSAQAGTKVSVRLSITAPHDVFHLAVTDNIPAGAEILDTRLKTSQLGIDGEPQSQVLFDPRRPYAQGWGWWLFNTPQVYDDHIAWTADRLPAGTYELTYTLVLLQPGQYRVLPARAWQLYFPEVQANSAGSVFEITP